jgi:hypothetical protein
MYNAETINMNVTLRLLCAIFVENQNFEDNELRKEYPEYHKNKCSPLKSQMHHCAAHGTFRFLSFAQFA